MIRCNLLFTGCKKTTTNSHVSPPSNMVARFLSSSMDKKQFRSRHSILQMLDKKRQNEKSLGSIRKDWRETLGSLNRYISPSLHSKVLDCAAYMTKSEEVSFGLPDNFHSLYSISSKLGEGAFGIVYEVVPSNTGRNTLDLAVKVVPKHLLVNRADFVALRQEAEIMYLLGGTLNVVQFFGAYEDKENIYLVVEHCVGGEVHKRLLKNRENDKSPPDELLAACYMADILHVVWQCHKLGILHGDLKLENFLFADNSIDAPLKLTDFGGAEFLNEGQVLKGLRGTPLYTAPEMLHTEYSFPIDMWSCGVILYKLLCGNFPFESGQFLDENIKHQEIELNTSCWENISAEAKDLVLKLLDRNESTRLTAEDALRHPWLRFACRTQTENVSHKFNGSLVQRLQFYHTLNGFQQAVFLEITRILPSDLIQELLVLFTDLSLDGSMQIGIEHIAKGLQEYGYKLTWGEVKMLLNRMDVNNDGFVDLNEFCCALLDWCEVQNDPRWDSILDIAFQIFDSNGDGKILLEDIQNNISEKIEYAIHDDLLRCFSLADTDNSGYIDLSEFKKMLFVHSDTLEYFSKRLR